MLILKLFFFSSFSFRADPHQNVMGPITALYLYLFETESKSLGEKLTNSRSRNPKVVKVRSKNVEILTVPISSTSFSSTSTVESSSPESNGSRDVENFEPTIQLKMIFMQTNIYRAYIWELSYFTL